MNRLELNRQAFYLKIIVQMAVLALLMVEAGSSPLLLWMFFLAILVILINLKQMNLPEDAAISRYGWLFSEWVLFLTLFPFVPYSPYFVLMIVLIVTAVTTIDSRYFQLFFVLIFGMTPGLHSMYMGAFAWQQLITFLLLIVFFMAFSYFYRKFEEQQWKLEMLNESLRGYVEKEKDWALEQERNRIARDLHDTVAHKSTGLIVQLQKMKMAYELGRDYDVRESMRESEQVARSMLNDMRQSVRMISPVETSESPFEQLFSDYGHLTDMRIRSEGIQHLYGLSLSHQADLYAICQEALTNAKGHGNATVVDIEVKKTATHLIITIRDNGVGVDENWKKGFGLTKMSERVEAAKGQWDFSKDKGAKITVKWPLQKGDSHD